MTENIKLLIQKIKDAKTILIFGHKNPDGDSVGSVLGLRYLIADNFGKTPDVIYDGNFPFFYDFIPGRADMVYAEKLKTKKHDLVIVLDTAILRQVGDAQMEFLNGAGSTIKIDHHKTSDAFADVNIVKTEFVATAEIIYEIAKISDWKISQSVATCLFVGMYTDTGSFNYIDNGNALHAAAELVDMGVDVRSMQSNLNACTRDDLIAQAAVLANAEFFYNGALALVSIPHKYYKKLDSGETPLLMRLRSAVGVKVLVILKEAKANEIHASMRSESTPIRMVAEKLGGGGHDFASGAKMTMGLNSAKEVVVQAFEDVF